MGQQIPEYRYTGIQSSLTNFTLALIKEDIALNTIVLRTKEDFERLKHRYKGDLYGAELAIFSRDGGFLHCCEFSVMTEFPAINSKNPSGSVRTHELRLPSSGKYYCTHITETGVRPMANLATSI